jgi:hypothetical protein
VTANLAPLVDLLRAAPPPALESVDVKGFEELTPLTIKKINPPNNTNSNKKKKDGKMEWELTLIGGINEEAVRRNLSWRRDRGEQGSVAS